MKELPSDQVGFARVVDALRPYLPDLTFVGGWAHRLYTLHELARPPSFAPLVTDDTDIATPLRLQSRGASIGQLLKQHGFKEEFSGDETPPVSEYRLGEEAGGLYVEFLAPQRGSGYRRDGSSDATVSIAGITAQKLKYLDVLLEERWSVRIGRSNGFAIEDAQVFIPNPASYLMQKVLVLRSRKSSKQPRRLVHPRHLADVRRGDRPIACFSQARARES